MRECYLDVDCPSHTSVAEEAGVKLSSHTGEEAFPVEPGAAPGAPMLKAGAEEEPSSWYSTHTSMVVFIMPS